MYSEYFESLVFVRKINAKYITPTNIINDKIILISEKIIKEQIIATDRIIDEKKLKKWNIILEKISSFSVVLATILFDLNEAISS